MLRACFNCYHNYTTDNVYQWDLNHVLEIKGLELAYAPTVHFCNKKSTEAIVVQSELVGDAITVDVPNELLQEPYNIIGYIHTYDANNAKTIEIVNIPLIKRIKPSDYQFTGNVEIMSFERLEKDFTDFVNQVEADFLAYKEEANAHIDDRIDDYIAKGYVNWENVLLKPNNITYMNTEDNTEIEAPEDPGDNSDTKDNVVTFTSGDGSGDAWTGVATLKSGEKHSSIFSKISTMFNNIRYLFKTLSTLYSRLGYKGNYTGNIDELVGLEQCGGYFIQVSNASGTQPFSSQYYYLELPIEGTGHLQRAVQYNTGEIKERFYTNNRWYPWTNTKANAPIRISSLTEIPPSESIAIPYDSSITYSACEIMFYAYGGFRQSVKIPLAGTIVKFMTSTTEWGGSFGTSFGNGGLTITNNSDKQKVTITHIYLIP